MQPVADLHLFQLAEIIVELGQRLIGRLIRGNPAIEIETGRPGQFKNTVAKQFDAARIDACGLVVFVDQPFEIGQRAIGFSPCQRRRQVIDDHGGGVYGPHGIQALVRKARPDYLLLVGDTTYDYLDHEGLGVDPMVPSLMRTSRLMGQTSADALYGDVDGDDIPDIPVGRLPVRTAAELANLVGKMMAHAPGSVIDGVLVADRSGVNENFAGDLDAVAAETTTTGSAPTDTNASDHA